jgi:hypothetical protein
MKSIIILSALIVIISCTSLRVAKKNMPGGFSNLSVDKFAADKDGKSIV